YNMVRILVGTLLEVGQGRIEPDAIKDILESKSRPRAGKTAPSQGLYLWRVFYDN
ncbi:tRNA pseudouridine(38-40) synthase TruA, partial [Priestia megaterium]|nr:tRNA pseudouridine(38-40) synthase TruA [Priestia megaterium]